MLIINTVRKSNIRNQISNIEYEKNQFWIRLALSGLCVVVLFGGCQGRSNLQKARENVRKADVYYEDAVKDYKRLIAEGGEPDNLYFEIGRLFYSHGEYERAVDSLRNSNLTQARKLLAISFYHRGEWTDALEIFNKEKIVDAEYLYYEGLTCEKLNLFDQALKAYRNIEGGSFAVRAKERIGLIQKEISSSHIKELDSEVYSILSAAPSAEEYPQAGALILSCDEKINITSAGTQETRMHYIIKILNERGKESFSETLIDYDSTYEKVELEYARTIKPDGRVLEVGARHIRDVSKYLNFPLYSNARVYIISFPEVAEGACIEYKVKIIRNQLINSKDFVLNYPLQTSEPIIAANFSLDLPKSAQVYFKITNENYNDFGAVLEPEQDNSAERVVYRWKFSAIPQIIPESNMPPGIEVDPAILISTFSGWSQVYDWWWPLAKDKISADAAIEAKVGELIKDKLSDEEKARAIYNFCASKIRYVAVEYGQAGYEPHKAEDIFKNKYGDCKDQAVLLVSMLRFAGLKAWPALIGAKGYYDLAEDFPAILFNHCIAAVSLGNEVVFLDPTAETCSFGNLPSADYGRKALLFKETGYEIKDIAAAPAGRNLVRHQLKIKLDSGGAIEAQKEIVVNGVYDQGQRYWLLYTQPELIREALKEKIQEVSIGGELGNYSIENLNDLDKPVVLSYSFSGPEYFTYAGSLRIMPQLTGLDTSLVAKAQRRYPVDFNILDCRELVFEIEIPEDLAVKYMPGPVNRENAWMIFNAEYSSGKNKIYFRQKSQLKKEVVSRGDYAEFRDFFVDLAKQVKQRIVLERRQVDAY